MGFSMFSSHSTPIAIDFGSASVKLLQIGTGNRPNVIAAAELPIPDEVRLKPDALFDLYAESLPALLQQGKFKGRKVVLAIPSTQTFVQHMQLAAVQGASRDELVKGQLQMQMGCDPGSIVVRTIDVGLVHRDGQPRTEIICFATARNTVMRYLNFLKKSKMNVVGVRTETIATVRAFDHLNRRMTDVDISTMYVDLGWGGTNVAIAHGRKIVFARAIQVGGRNFDQHIAESLHCDATTARAHRLAMAGPAAPTNRSEAAASSAALLNVAATAHEQSKHQDDEHAHESEPATGGTAVREERRVMDSALAFGESVPNDGDAPLETHGVDLSEAVDMVADELSMCIRYHRGVFPDRHIDRVIFLGGEARQMWLCQNVIENLRLPAQLGDPLARLSRAGLNKTPNVNFDEPQPGWAVACGLCLTPTDL